MNEVVGRCDLELRIRSAPGLRCSLAAALLVARMGDSANSTGSYTLSNGVVNVLLQAHVGEAGIGILTINDGIFNVGQNPFCLGDGDFGPGGVGTLNMKSGTLNTARGVDLWLGE